MNSIKTRVTSLIKKKQFFKIKIRQASSQMLTILPGFPI